MMRACDDAVDWSRGLTIDEAYATCPKGEWLMWYAMKWRVISERNSVWIAATCLKTVSDLMFDKRSKHAITFGLEYGEGQFYRKQLLDVSSHAYDAYWDACHLPADPDSDSTEPLPACYGYAACAATHLLSASAALRYCAVALGSYGGGNKREENELLTADIVRSYISIDKYKAML